jgi:uncharacterized protein YbaP (TraB family)
MNGKNCRRSHAAAVILLIVFAFSTLSGCASETKTPDTPLLWEVQYGDATLYLFGSIHVATKDIYLSTERHDHERLQKQRLSHAGG